MKIAWRPLLDATASVTMIAAGAVLLWQHWASNSSRDRPVTSVRIPASPLSLAGAPRDGDRDARVGLLIYSDFQCPYCARFTTETLPILRTEYVQTGKIQLLFRHFPLQSIHRFARSAASFAACAEEQDRFWPLHDSLFADQAHLDAPTIRSDARSMGIDISALDSCVLRMSQRGQVENDIASGELLGIQGTPMFFLGSVNPERNELVVRSVIHGARPLKEFEAAISSMLQRR